MKVLLVQAYLGGNEPPVYPLGLACIAASIPKHETLLFDTNTVQKPFDELKNTVQNFNPDVVGISLRNIDSTNKSKVVFYYTWLKDLITVIKDNCPVKIIIGGSGFSMFAREIMEQEPGIDFGIYLEGEDVFSALLNNLDRPDEVPSIYYRRGTTIHFTGKTSPVDINATSIPSWEALPLEPYLKGRDAIGIETKRGCSLSCIYCVYGFLNGRRYRLKQPERVVDEIELLVREHYIKQFTFVDSIFNVPQSHARAICREMVDRNLNVHWSAWFNERFIDQEFVNLLVEAGCNHMIFSPDGFSDPVLKKLGKNITRKSIVDSLHLLKKNDAVEVGYNFFKNPPGQHPGNFFGMLLFCLQAKLLMGKRVHFEFSVLRVEPHTGLHRIALDEGVVDKNQSLLRPVYYTNHRTRYLEIPLNFALSLRGK